MLWGRVSSVSSANPSDDYAVYRDDWGVPHLRASDALRLSHAQGRVTALDRAWQLEVERHRAQGSSAAFLGADAVTWDRFARQSRLDDTARRCHEALDPQTAAWVRAYVDGVNEGLAEGALRDERFARTGHVPTPWEPWVPLSIWIATHILFAGFATKLWRERVGRALGDEAVTLFATDGPGTAGSNGWLVPGDRTATGAAIIAGDPHRFIEDPGVYQQIRLSCPEFDVLGLAVPGIPGLGHFGHTGGAAWAITNAMADYQDLYVERLRPAPGGDGVEALGPDGAWEPVHRHTETISVAGGDPVEVEVLETARGPVITREESADQTLSLRYPPRVRRDLGFAVLPALLRARTVADVDRALDGWAEPVNVVHAADTEGGLLHRVAGAVPLRDPANRLRPVPAWDARYAWRGWAETPAEPVRDFAVMANARGIAAPLGVEFAPPHRADRIRELLSGSTDWSAKAMADVHADTRLASAAALLDLLPDLADLSPAAEALRARLLAWDRHMAADSTDATVFAAFRTATVRGIAADPALAGLADAPTGPEVFHPWLYLLPRVGYALEGLLTTPLLPALDRVAHVRAALEETAAAQGADTPWSRVHRLVPWSALPDPDARWPGLGGDHDCVNATSSVPGFTDLTARASAARYAWDLARREDSLWAVPLGADGVTGSPHHRDQLALWARCELVPVVTDWARLTKETHA
ncbi:penicillin acylase family protein [Streptomyces sp. NBC_00513]|uniref:penicillin acylase family protein n=1 Tax=unclassified Streptomyces TaxID=2593676 RepID=UPI002250A453|nr:penicillin acylase family protein [Streptomyces sp. NBC_00424]MCX5073224.1 penicillin acylase family protein [Streptomyces sp. NBC_00424]WUD43501.1 penicillin acylase family protein [Streptomyces sp. NBC_00513]